MRQRWALCKHSSKSLYILSFDVSARQVECVDSAPDCHQWELSIHEQKLFSDSVITGVIPGAPTQTDNGRQTHVVHYLFDSLRRPSQNDLLPADEVRAVLRRNGSLVRAKASAGSSNGCVCVACLVVCLLLFCVADFLSFSVPPFPQPT